MWNFLCLSHFVIVFFQKPPKRVREIFLPDFVIKTGYTKHLDIIQIFSPIWYEKNFYHSPTLSVKIGFNFFYSSSDMHQSHHLVGCQATGINSLLRSFLYALRCLSLLCQTKSLIWIIVSGSSSSKLTTSRLYY